jgi:hypothetical protein
VGGYKGKKRTGKTRSIVNKIKMIGFHLNQTLLLYAEETPLNNSTQVDKHNRETTPITAKISHRYRRPSVPINKIRYERKPRPRVVQKATCSAAESKQILCVSLRPIPYERIPIPTKKA